ncbi:MAG: sialidase family protein [Pseudomonadota bacterium]
MHRSAHLICALCTLLLFACSEQSTESLDEDQYLIDNPAAEGSSLPRLSRARNDDLLLSWVTAADSAHQLLFARFDGQAWSEPAIVASGTDWFINYADFPSVSEPAPGVLLAHWLQRNGDSTYAYGVRIALSHDQGQSWSTPIWAHADRSAAEHGFVSSYPTAQGFGLVWLDGRDYANPAIAEPNSSLRYAEFDLQGTALRRGIIDERVCDCCQTDVASSRDRRFIVYRDRSLREIRDIVLAQGPLDGPIESAAIVSADNWEIDACPVNGPSVASNGNAIAMAWYSHAGNVGKIKMARSTDRGVTFKATELGAAAAPVGRVDIELMNDARMAISWLDKIPNEGVSLRMQLFGLHGQSSGPLDVAKVATGNGTGFPQMMRHGNALMFAWTDATGAEPQIKTARIPVTVN